MKSIIMLSALVTLIMMILMMISVKISKKTTMDKEKSSPVECGINPISSSQIPFSVQFFLIAILFLIFDVEITLLIPIPLIFSWGPLHFLLCVCGFITLLTLGLFYEWKMGALEWEK